MLIVEMLNTVQYIPVVITIVYLDYNSMYCTRDNVKHSAIVCRMYVGYGGQCVAWCRLCGFQPFWHNTKMDTVLAILNGNYSFDTPEWQDLSTSSKDLVRCVAFVWNFAVRLRYKCRIKLSSIVVLSQLLSTEVDCMGLARPLTAVDY